ncbi:hypothetical protein MUP35_00525 [Patescibacteria group bacterium]|nr:hypothetical protein [Patescibacteria group bacterium]
MTKERLISNLLNLPLSELGEIQKDEEIIEGNDGSIHYKMTRHIIKPKGINQTFDGFFLSVSGPFFEKFQFINNLSKDLGKPVLINTSLYNPEIALATWDAKEVTKRLQN